MIEKQFLKKLGEVSAVCATLHAYKCDLSLENHSK